MVVRMEEEEGEVGGVVDTVVNRCVLLPSFTSRRKRSSKKYHTPFNEED